MAGAGRFSRLAPYFSVLSLLSPPLFAYFSLLSRAYAGVLLYRQLFNALDPMTSRQSAMPKRAHHNIHARLSFVQHVFHHSPPNASLTAAVPGVPTSVYGLEYSTRPLLACCGAVGDDSYPLCSLAGFVRAAEPPPLESSNPGRSIDGQPTSP